MGNVAAKLKFWTRKSPRAAQGNVVPGSHILRDFVYLDVPLVSSYLEQLTGGMPYGAEVSREYHGGGEAGLSMPLVQVKLEGGGSRGYRENQAIYWARYARLEEALRETGKLIDLTEETTSPATLRADAVFLAVGHTSLEPDWANWQSGVSLVKLVFQKLRQLGAFEAVQQAQPDETGMVPMLYGPEGTAVVMVRQDAVSQLFKDKLPDKPPVEIRRLFKPSAVTVRLTLGDPGNAVMLEASGDLEHFTPHRIAPYLLGPVHEDMHVLGLVRQREKDAVRFIPLAVFATV